MSSPDTPLAYQSRGYYNETNRSPGDQGSTEEQSTAAALPATGFDPTKEQYRMAVDAGTAAPFDDPDEPWTTTKSTPKDAADMKRMGKQQQLVRRFQFLSTVSFVALATAAWEIGLFVLTPGLVDGGRAGLVWNVLWNIVGFGLIYLSMAEVRPNGGSLVQTMILLNDDSYGFPSWQGTLLAFMAVAMAYTGVVYGAKFLPYWQNAVFIVHVGAYLGYIIPIWVNSPRASHKQVWTGFENQGGWSSMGLSVLVGQLAGISTQCGGIDTAAHM
ncbi:hypothetical protein LTR10_012506 [Elasticomyces elasticus]|nr:hypothetical protein LTR10_012506 [Elasticomyces elasticus]KAK4965980.1 hypothetical protein LTR42_011994 [Elasticomyces elasticus]